MSFFKLIKEFRANDPKIIEIFKKYEIHIMPLLNPDGYEYSHTTVNNIIISIKKN